MMSGWDYKTESFDEFCRRQERERAAALKAPATFRYEDAPYLNIAYTCSGAECGTNSIVLDVDHDYSLICTDCKTRWSSDDQFDGADGELLANQRGVAEEINDLPIKERY